MNLLFDLIRRWTKLLWRHRWTFLVPVATLLLPATLYAVSLPDVYDAKATVLVREVVPGRGDSHLPRETSDRPDEIMATVRDRIFTRDNLEKVVPVLAPELKDPSPRSLEEMAGSFTWEQVGVSSFQLIRTDQSPARAAKAVNTLLEAFIARERLERLQRAERSCEFHEKEEKEAKRTYDEAYERLTAYRAKNESTLPDRKDSITTELSRLQMQISSQIGQIAGQRSRVQMLDDQLVAGASQLPTGSGQTSVLEESLRMQLSQENLTLKTTEQALAEALATKTDRHPDVIRLSGAVQVHRDAVKVTFAALETERRESRARTAESSAVQIERRRKRLQAFRDAAQTALDRAEQTVTDYLDSILQLQSDLAGIPATTRGLEPIQKALEDARKLHGTRELAHQHARDVVRFNREEEVSRVTGFEVNAWASVPVNTSGPARLRYLLTSMVLGVLIGYGLLVLRHRQEGATITSPEDLSGLFPSAVVVSIPLLGPGRQLSLRHRFAEVGVTAYVVLVFGASAFLLATYKGWVAAPECLRGFFGGGA